MKYQTIKWIMDRIQKATRKHGPLVDHAHMLGALTLECYEAREAMQRRNQIDTYNELLDVATVAIRAAEAIEARGFKP